jgi:hypothetical protein
MTTTEPSKQDDHDPNDILWGAVAIGRAIGVDRRRAYFLLEHQKIPARQIGRSWVASRRRLYKYIVGEAQ